MPSDELAGNKYIAIQRMAQAAGLAQLEENSHLCVHPKFGPWIALRCALVFDNVLYTEPQAVPHFKPLSVSTQQYIQMAMRSALRKPSINLEDAGQDNPELHAQSVYMTSNVIWLSLTELPMCSCMALRRPLYNKFLGPLHT